MIIPFKIKFSLVIYLLVIVAVSMPEISSAQRFSHPSTAGRGGTQQSEPQGYTAANRPTAQPPGRSINGGSQNYGNHNNNRPATTVNAPRPVEQHPVAPKRTTEPVIENAKSKVYRSAIVHENVNVYHPSNMQYHQYSYHPYHPSTWGASWHPIGFIAASLARDVFIFSLANRQYYYDEGVYYQPVSGGYTVVSAPIGAVVGSLPDGYETVQLGDDYFYYYGGTFYIGLDQGYQVVDAPTGAIVMNIPDGATQQNINGEIYLFYNNTYYEPVSFNGEDAYQVVQIN
jgi:hypothetical protein